LIINNACSITDKKGLIVDNIEIILLFFTDYQLFLGEKKTSKLLVRIKLWLFLKTDIERKPQQQSGRFYQKK